MENVQRWLNEIAPMANDQVFLFVAADGSAKIVGVDGETVTSMMDWDILLSAPTLEELGGLCSIDFEEA